MSAPRHVTLATETDLDGFRAACRALVAGRVPPEAVTWSVLTQPGAPPAAPEPDGPVIAKLLVPASFVEQCRDAIRHRDPSRFARLYRLLWRLQHEPTLRQDAQDPDRLAVDRLAAEVRREAERLQAEVRFHAVQAPGAAGASLAPAWHVAWIEPQHHVVEPVATFFAERFGEMRWALLARECSACWDGARLHFGPGAPAPADGSREALARTWLHVAAGLPDDAMSRSQEEDPSGRRPKPGPTGTSPRLPDPPHSARPVSLDDLAQALDRCRECPLGALATQGVPGEGPRRAKLMFVGEQPGDQEDLKGRPFVGPAGQLLDRAFKELAWPRDQVYVTNAVKHFKFELRGKRRIHKTPAQQEMAACLHWLESEIELVQPEALVALGATAARQLMSRMIPVLRERGHWLKRADGRRVLITLHPSALLRADPEDRDAAYGAWLDDLRAADGYFSRRAA